MIHRWIYASFKSLEAARAALEEFFATGEIRPAELPRIERIAGRWRITLTEIA